MTRPDAVGLVQRGAPFAQGLAVVRDLLLAYLDRPKKLGPGQATRREDRMAFDVHRDRHRQRERQGRLRFGGLPLRCQADLPRLRTKLVDTGKLSVSSIGRVGVACVSAHDFFETAMAMLDADPRALIREGGTRRAA